MSPNLEIISAVAAEVLARRKYWIGGVPTHADMAAAELYVARQLKISPHTLRAVCAGTTLQTQP